jgi:hypothetical protein
MKATTGPWPGHPALALEKIRAFEKNSAAM